MPAPLAKRYRKEKVRAPASGASVRDRLEAFATLRGRGRDKTDEPAQGRPDANPKAVEASARRAARGMPANGKPAKG